VLHSTRSRVWYGFVAAIESTLVGIIPLMGSVPDWPFGINYLHGFFDGLSTACHDVHGSNTTQRTAIELSGGALTQWEIMRNRSLPHRSVPWITGTPISKARLDSPQGSSNLTVVPDDTSADRLDRKWLPAYSSYGNCYIFDSVSGPFPSFTTFPFFHCSVRLRPRRSPSTQFHDNIGLHASPRYFVCFTVPNMPRTTSGVFGSSCSPLFRTTIFRTMRPIKLTPSVFRWT